MRLVIARCSVDYQGRLSAHLPMATRLLMVKADGCVAIHADGGAYKPLNWMNAPNRLEEGDGVWTVTGIWSHFACSDEPDHPANAAQERAFRDALAGAERAGLRPEVRHLANSAGAILRPSSRFNGPRAR